MSIDATRATWKLSTQVTAIQKLLLLALADRAGEDGECWPSLKRLEVDTNINRKTLIDNRKKLIGLGLLEFTGEMKGKKKQIPVMRLTYINQREKEFTSTEIGTRTSTEIGTRTSTENGTLNLKEESKKRIVCESDDSPLVSPEGLALVYTEELPLLSHPRDLKKLNKELLKTLNALIKRWPIDISDKGNKLTYEVFRGIIRKLKEIDYWMFKPEKDAGMIVFCRISNMQTAIEKLIAHEKQGRK